MINTFRAMYRNIKSWLNYGYYKTIYTRKTLKDFTIKEGMYAIVNVDEQLKNDDTARYFYIICMYLIYAGFKLIIKINWDDFKKPRKFKELLLKQNHIFVRNCVTPQNTIALVKPDIANHVIHLSYGYTLHKSLQTDCMVPYPMHPFQYDFYSSPAFSKELKNSTRTVKIFFAGRTNQSSYPKEKIEKFFKVIPRINVIESVTRFNKSRLLRSDSDKLTLNQLLYSKDYINEVVISEVKTPEEDWLKILTRVDFFICPPGVRMPWCHNSVEAMSAGAIPILEYADLFYPRLENLKNCLSYSNYEELQTAIENALAMSQSEIANMRKNVLNYYNTYLSIESIAEKIKTFSNSPDHELKVTIPFIPTKEEIVFIGATNVK